MIKGTSDLVKKAGAATIIATIVLPWLVLGSVKVLTLEKNQAVMKNEEKNIVKKLDKIDAKLDKLILLQRR